MRADDGLSIMSGVWARAGTRRARTRPDAADGGRRKCEIWRRGDNLDYLSPCADRVSVRR